MMELNDGIGITAGLDLSGMKAGKYVTIYPLWTNRAILRLKGLNK
jgi:hypothetical protein